MACWYGRFVGRQIFLGKEPDRQKISVDGIVADASLVLVGLREPAESRNMSEDVTRTRLDVAVRRAGNVAERYRQEEMMIVSDAAANGRLGSSMLELKVLDAAKKHYRDACSSVIRDMGGKVDGLAHALGALEPEFHRKPDGGRGAFGTRFDPGFAQQLSKVRADILEDLEHGLFDMDKNDKGVITINQSGPNSVAAVGGDHSTVSVSVAYSNVQQLIPDAINEVRGLAIPQDDRDNIIDHIQSIEDESRKQKPDDSRIKRLGRKIASELEAVTSAAATAGGAALGTGAVDALLKSLM
jgi:hypothetical protein